MAITITLDDDLVAGLENKAKKQQLSVEQFAIGILTEAVEESESETLQEVVARIQATAPNPSLIRPATGNLADLLNASPDDPCFDLENWERQWSILEAELKAITRANDVAEGRGGFPVSHHFPLRGSAATGRRVVPNDPLDREAHREPRPFRWASPR